MAYIDEILIDEELVRYAARQVQEPMVLAQLFPEQKKATLDLKMFKGANNIPVSAHIHAFDVPAELGSLDGREYDTATLLLVKRQYRISEELLIRLSNTNSDPVKQEIKSEIYDYVNLLVDSIKVRFERMRAELLQTGKIKINENGYKGTIDYGMPSENLVTGDWTTDDANPLSDIEKWCDIVEDKSGGIRPARALTRRTKMRELLGHPKVRKQVLGSDADRLLSINEFNSFAQEQGLPTLGVYEGQYREELPSGKKEVKKYIDDKSFILLPAEKVGDTFYGPTAEAVELSKDGGIQVQQNGFITMTTYRQPDSPAKFIKASATGLPTAPYIDNVLTATVE